MEGERDRHTQRESERSLGLITAALLGVIRLDRFVVCFRLLRRCANGGRSNEIRNARGGSMKCADNAILLCRNR